MAAVHGRLGRRPVSRFSRALVERHHDVAAQFFLGLNTALGGQLQRAAVHMGSKGNAIIGDLAQGSQAEHLKPS